MQLVMTTINILCKICMGALVFTILYACIQFLPKGEEIVNYMNKKFFHRHQKITNAIVFMDYVAILYAVLTIAL